MALRDRLAGVIDALLGVSAYDKQVGYGPPDDAVRKIRENLGGTIQPLPTTKLRWYLKDLENAQFQADAGYLNEAARLYAAMRRDGVFSGLLSTRTDGLVGLPKRFYGSEVICDALRSQNETRSVFDEMCPPAELGMLSSDGIVLGVGVGELIPVKGRSYPVLVRLEPEFLYYHWAQNRWYYQSIAGNLPITPGDGRWVLHVPGGRLNPWRWGLWPSLGRSFINKEHAIFHRANYSSKLANPARVAIPAIGATQVERTSFFRKLMAWGTNTVIEMPPGWEAKLLESNGRGWDVFQEEINTCDNEMMVALAGQIVTTTGGSGFANADIHQTIRRDLVRMTGESLSYTVNTQVLPQFIAQHWGVDAVNKPAMVQWDTATPTDRQKETEILAKFGEAVAALTEALAPYGEAPDVKELCARFGLPLDANPQPVKPLQQASEPEKEAA